MFKVASCDLVQGVVELLEICTLGIVYSDNIQDAILDSVKGITVGSEVVRAVIYADDISPITSGSSATNLVLNAVSKAGTSNSYKFKPSKCKVVGSIAVRVMIPSTIWVEDL